MKSSKFESILADRASAMRAAPTTTEALLWQELRGSRLGAAFRRQVVLGRFIADFAAMREKLVVKRAPFSVHARPGHCSVPY